MTLEEVSQELNLPLDDLQFRMDGRIEWVCEHGVGHTVWAPLKMEKYGYIHGCDGCCHKIPRM